MNLNNTGPRIFIRRLIKSGVKLKKIELLNPDLKKIKDFKSVNKILIGRLDGAFYFDCTFINLSQWLKFKNYYKLSKIFNFFSYLKSNKFTNKIFNFYLNRYSSWVLKNAKGLIFQSELSLKMHEKFLGFKKNKPFTIIHNGIDLNQFKPKKKNFVGTPALLVSCSVYRPHKRLHEVIRLTNSLLKVYPKIKLHILGDLDILTKEFVSQMDLSNCIFHGRIKPSQLPLYYCRCDIQVHLGIFDPCPNVVVEGLASGLPVVTPLQSGASELIGKKNIKWAVDEKIKMKYFETYNFKKIPKIPIEKYQKKIIKIFKNINHHKKIARKQAVENLDIKIVAIKYNNFFNQVTTNERQRNK